MFHLVFDMNCVIMYACNPVLADLIDATVTDQGLVFTLK